MSISSARVHVVAAAFIAAAVFAAVAPISAHDFWIAPSAYRPKVGTLVGLRLLVRPSLIGDPVPRAPSAIERFVISSVSGAVNGSGEKPIPGRDGGDPAGIFRVDTPGLLVVGYQSVPRLVELTADKFDQYL